MSSLKIEERFSVQAPVERVWRFLLDPEQIAPCLPGAELLQVENERTFHGQMKVKVGPVTVAYQGTIELTEVDEAGRRVKMLGKGKEKGGAGSAKMTMESRLEPQDDGAVAISVTSDVELAGRIVRFGRGMIQSVSAQLFKQFAGNVRQALERAEAGAGAGAVPDTGTDAVPDTGTGAVPDTGTATDPGAAQEAASTEAETAAPDSAGLPAAAAPDEAGAPAVGPAPEPALTESAADQAVETAPPDGEAAPAAPAAPVAPAAPAAPSAPARVPDTRPGRELAPRPAEPVRALPLLFRALWDVVSGFFKRLLGRKP